LPIRGDGARSPLSGGEEESLGRTARS
jgi:hypothetical protein